MNNKFKTLLLILSTGFLVSCGGGSTNSGGDITNPVGFSKLLGPTFNDPLCTNCHGFEAENAKKIDHREKGRLAQDCQECHTPGNWAPEWRAPFQSFSFSGISSSEICEAIKIRSANDLQRLRDDLANSPLAQWAINPYTTRRGTRPGAPPGSMPALLALVDQWIAGGASCD